MAEHKDLAEWHGKDLVDRDGHKIGKLEDVYVDVETDEPMFGTVKEGLFARHLRLCRCGGSRSAPTTCRYRYRGTRSRTPPTSTCTETSSPRTQSQPYTTTTSSTTRPRTPRAVAGSPVANASQPDEAFWRASRGALSPLASERRSTTTALSRKTTSPPSRAGEGIPTAAGNRSYTGLSALASS
jgi:hypothetical protein